MCRCGSFVTAPIEKMEKEAKMKGPRKPLQRGKGLKRTGKKKRKRTALEKRLMDRWWSEARQLPCARCERRTNYGKGIIVEGHHIVRQALIEARGKAAGWTAEELARRLWDTRNRLPLCRDCHHGHHRKLSGKLKWSLVRKAAPKVEVFAREIELMREARREYA